MPTAAPETGGGGTAGLQDGVLFGVGGLAVLAGMGSLAYRRRLARKLRADELTRQPLSDPGPAHRSQRQPPPAPEPADRSPASPRPTASPRTADPPVPHDPEPADR